MHPDREGTALEKGGQRIMVEREDLKNSGGAASPDGFASSAKLKWT